MTGGGEILPFTIFIEALKHSDKELGIRGQQAWFKTLLHYLVTVSDTGTGFLTILSYNVPITKINIWKASTS